MPGTILYGTSLLPAQDLGKRLSRQRQSTTAQALLNILRADLNILGPDFSTNLSSKSHSRTAAAAAVAGSGVPALGIDIEFMAEDRPFAEILSFLSNVGRAEVELEEFYRCWTFAEAYFKAFQKLPPYRTIRSVGEDAHTEGARQLGDGTSFLHRRIAERFQLCLVWRPAVETCELRYISVPA